ncbi:MAG: hypothetical protein KKE79_00090 [Actinobacteria bacterium]|nr:hypothetical protein [Actinomycetota bacterium]
MSAPKAAPGETRLKAWGIGTAPCLSAPKAAPGETRLKAWGIRTAPGQLPDAVMMILEV